MRITEIHIYQRDLPVVGGSFRMASATVTSLDTTLLRVNTDAGIVGYGEVCPLGPVYQPQHALGARAALQEVAPGLIGQNPLHPERIRAAMERALSGTRYAKAAVDIACWDIQGKAFGVRACDLLGGAFQEQVPCYSSIDVVPPEQAAERAKEHIAQGYRRVQLKVGGRTLEEDLAAVRKVSEVIKPGIALVVDANGGWTVREAVLASLQCRDLPVVLEQPCRTYEEVLALRGRIAHPVLLDEAAEDLGLVLRSINDRAADGFSLKCTRIGGLSAMRTIRDVCRCAGLPLTCDDAWGGDVIAAACVHLGATVEPRLFEGSWIAAPHIEGHYDHENGPRPLHGHIALPRGPGLGIVPDISQWGEPVLSFA